MRSKERICNHIKLSVKSIKVGRMEDEIGTKNMNNKRIK